MPPGSAVPVVVYAAKSSPDEKDSTASQVEHVRERLAAIGGRFEVGGPFAEENVSGFRGSRGPQLEAAIRAATGAVAAHGRAELWVHHSSRLARGSGKLAQGRSLLKVYADLEEQGVALRSVSDDEFLTNPMLVGVASAQNHKYSEDLSAHVQRGKREQFGRGERLGGPVPDGYLKANVTERHGRPVYVYGLDPERAPVLERLFTLAAAGTPDAEVARTLNREGHRTKAGRTWSRRRVQDTVTNPHYAGRVARGRSTPGAALEWVQGTHPALVAAVTFDRVQALRAGRDLATAEQRRSSTGRPRLRSALSGLAVCARCGGRMVVQTSSYTRRDGTRARKYLCPEYHGATGACDQPPIDAELVDRAVVSRLHHTFLDFAGWRDSVVAERDGERASVEAGLGEARARLAKLDRVEPKLRERYLDAVDAIDGGDGPPEGAAGAAYEAVMAEREELRERVGTLEARREGLADHTAPVDAMLDFWNALSRAVRGSVEEAGEDLALVNAALREHFDRFELDSLTAPAKDGATQVAPALKPSVYVDLLGEPHGGGDPLLHTTSGQERIVPPVGAFEAASREGLDPQA